MRSKRQCQWWMWTLVATAMVTAGCPDNEPTPSHYRDLGESGRALVPGGSPYANVKVAEGTAQWVELREPGATEEETHAHAAHAGGGGDDGSDDDAVEAQVREMIAEYNEIAAERDFEELLLYHVESERELLGPLMAATGSLLGKFDALRDALNEKLPDESDRIASTFAALTGGSAAALSVESLTVESDTEVSAVLRAGSGPRACRFKLIDEEWTIEMPEVATMAAMKPMVDMVITAVAAMVDGLKSGTMPPATVLAQVEQMSQAVEAARKAASPGEHESDAASEPGEPAVEDEERAPADEGDGD